MAIMIDPGVQGYGEMCHRMSNGALATALGKIGPTSRACILILLACQRFCKLQTMTTVLSEWYTVALAAVG